MSTDNFSTSPPQYGRIARLRGFLPLSSEDASPMATHGQGALTSLIRSRSGASLHNMHRRPSSALGGRDTPDEEAGNAPQLVRRNSRDASEIEEFRPSTGDERRLSAVLFGPQMRSQRLIGNSNPRYRWEKYWKTEEELKQMKKPM
jgi:hypothetical protein